MVPAAEADTSQTSPITASATSTAQVRSGQTAAQASDRSAWAAQARTRSSPSGSSAALIDTAVCEALCGPP